MLVCGPLPLNSYLDKEKRLESIMTDFYRPYKRKKEMDMSVHEKALLEVREVVECPVCYSVPKFAPIYRCSNGHVLCRDCNRKISKCPSCKVDLHNERCLISEKLIATLLFSCKYIDYGCMAEKKANELEVHEISCVYRKVKCPQLGIVNCKEYVHVSNLVDHLKDHKVIEEKRLFSASSFSAGDSSFDEEMIQWKVVHFSENTHHFYLFRVKKNTIWYVWVYIWYLGVEPDNYEYTFVLKSPNNETMQVTADCMPLEDHPFDSFVNGNTACFIFTNATARKFRYNEKLHYEIEIKKKDTTDVNE